MGIVSTFLRALNTKKVDPYPVEILKRVDQPTTIVRESEIPRVDERESGFNRALRGDFGPHLTKERHRFVVDSRSSKTSGGWTWKMWTGNSPFRSMPASGATTSPGRCHKDPEDSHMTCRWNSASRKLKKRGIWLF